MDRIRKLLRSLSAKEKKAVNGLLEKVYARKLKGSDVKRLKGHLDIYRVRMGDIRVIFHDDGTRITILFAGRRNDNTYHNY